jgi:hypothetical protein
LKKASPVQDYWLLLSHKNTVIPCRFNVKRKIQIGRINMRKVINVGSILIVILLSFYITSSQGKKPMSKYRWYPTESAPKLYPIEIVKGDLIFSDGSSIYIPDHKIVSNGWGETNSTYISGDDIKAIPVQLDISWFSYVENKFFSGSFTLPYDEILSQFEKGMISPVNGDKTTYNRIIVGLAPEGEVSVWLTAEAVTTEVANFKAHEALLDWSIIIDNDEVSREEYIAIVLEEAMEKSNLDAVKANGAPSGLWETYRQQSLWQPEIIGSSPFSMWVKSFNGEQEYFNFSNSDNSRTHRGVPKKIKINWQHSNKQNFTATIVFDEQEIFDAYSKLTSGNPDHELSLLLEISEQSHTVDVFVKDGTFILKLESYTIQRYKME